MLVKIVEIKMVRNGAWNWFGEAFLENGDSVFARGDTAKECLENIFEQKSIYDGTKGRINR